MQTSLSLPKTPYEMAQEYVDTMLTCYSDFTNLVPDKGIKEKIWKVVENIVSGKKKLDLKQIATLKENMSANDVRQLLLRMLNSPHCSQIDQDMKDAICDVHNIIRRIDHLLRKQQYLRGFNLYFKFQKERGFFPELFEIRRLPRTCQTFELERSSVSINFRSLPQEAADWYLYADMMRSKTEGEKWFQMVWSHCEEKKSLTAFVERMCTDPTLSEKKFARKLLNFISEEKVPLKTWVPREEHSLHKIEQFLKAKEGEYQKLKREEINWEKLIEIYHVWRFMGDFNQFCNVEVAHPPLEQFFTDFEENLLEMAACKDPNESQRGHLNSICAHPTISLQMKESIKIILTN